MHWFKVLQQAMPIGYGSDEITNKTKLAYDKDTRSP